MHSVPTQNHRQTQTEPQPVRKSTCIPLQRVDEDGKTRYCYHGGKCRCELCEQLRQNLLNELDGELECFVPHSRLKLVPPMRFAKPKQYKLTATRISPEMAMQLYLDHLLLRRRYPIYYLPDMYFMKNAWKYQGPQDKETQTEKLLKRSGSDGCICFPDKSKCWDL